MSRLRDAIARANDFVAEKTDIPDEARATLPLLDLRDGHQFVVLAYHLSENIPPTSRSPRRILFPFRQVSASLDDDRVEMTSLDADDFGLILPEGTYIGDLGDLMQYDSDRYHGLVSAYVDALDRLADSEFLVKGITTTLEARELAYQVRQTMSAAAEHALTVYYNGAGAHMLHWIVMAGA
jgi:hypothetical protein